MCANDICRPGSPKSDTILGVVTGNTETGYGSSTTEGAAKFAVCIVFIREVSSVVGTAADTVLTTGFVVVVVKTNVNVFSVVGFRFRWGDGLRVGRLYPDGRGFLVVVERVGRVVVERVVVERMVVLLVVGLLAGRRVDLGFLVVVVDDVGACFLMFFFLLVFLEDVEPKRSPNKSSPKRLKPV